MGAPRKGQGGVTWPLDFDINFSHIITDAPRVEIQMHFWKGPKFAGSVRHPMTKMLSATGGLCPPDQGFCPWTPLGALSPDPRYRLVLRTRHGASQPLTPSAAYDPLEKSCGRPWLWPLVSCTKIGEDRVCSSGGMLWTERHTRTHARTCSHHNILPPLLGAK